MYEHGVRFARDITKAKLMFQRAVELDPLNFEAWYELGMLQKEELPVQDLKYLFEPAAFQGCVLSQLELCHIYDGMNDEDWSDEERRSYFWLQRAIKQGYGKAEGFKQKRSRFIKYRRVENCQKMVLLLLLNRKYEKYTTMLSIFPYDIVLIISKFLWQTRREEIWEMKVPVYLNE